MCVQVGEADEFAHLLEEARSDHISYLLFNTVGSRYTIRYYVKAYLPDGTINLILFDIALHKN